MPEPCCSICGKKRSEVARLLGGPKVYTCDACVALRLRVVDADDTVPTAAGPMLRVRFRVRVRFLDGTIHICRMKSGWLPFLHEGEELGWCEAAQMRVTVPLPVVAVRSAH